jgi:hypothetical protein
MQGVHWNDACAGTQRKPERYGIIKGLCCHAFARVGTPWPTAPVVRQRALASGVCCRHAFTLSTPRDFGWPTRWRGQVKATQQHLCTACRCSAHGPTKVIAPFTRILHSGSWDEPSESSCAAKRSYLVCIRPKVFQWLQERLASSRSTRRSRACHHGRIILGCGHGTAMSSTIVPFSLKRVEPAAVLRLPRRRKGVSQIWGASL